MSSGNVLGVAVSTAHRLLFVSQDPVPRLHRAGPALVKLGACLAPSEPVGYAATALREIATPLGETISLQVSRGRDVLVLSSYEAPQLLRVSSRAVQSCQRTASRVERPCLGFWPRRRFWEDFPSERLEVFTGSSIALRADLFRELEIVREQGYATNFGESEIGVSGVAVAVSVPSIAPRALAVAPPRVRLSKCVRTNAFRIFSTHCGGTIQGGGSRPLNNSENISAQLLTGVAGTCNPRRDALVGTPKVGVVDAHHFLSWSRCSSSHQFERMAKQSCPLPRPACPRTTP
ncbi:hypothetical protein FXW78_27815 [Rhodococcus opacus]|nr:hypothetical protein [Rhodococcus opacus]